MSPIETAAETDTNKLVRPRKLSIGRLLCNHFHWKCLIGTVLISVCVSHVTYCQISGWANGTLFHHHHHHYHHYASLSHFSPLSSNTSTSSSSSLCATDYLSVISTVLGAVFYLLYLCECWHHFAKLGMAPRYSVGQVLALVDTMRNAIPVVWWKSVSYHYVRRTRRVLRYRNGDAISTTQVYYERVNSNSSGNVFLYDECGYKDLSKNIVDLHKFAAVRVRFSKGFVFACLQAANEFEDQRTRFFAENEMHDDYMEVREGLDLANLPFVERLLVFPPAEQRQRAMPKQNGGGGGTALAIAAEGNGAPPQRLALPWWMRTWVYWLASLLLCSWPLRLIAEYQTAHVHFQFTKLFGTNYLSPSSVNYTGPLTRTSTMESNELEEATRRNYLIVPSYSEAILLDPMDPQQQRDQFVQPANFFRQILSYPWRCSETGTTPSANVTTVPPNGSAYYGSTMDGDGQQWDYMKNSADNLMAIKRSRSISFLGKENSHGGAPSTNQHLPSRTNTSTTTVRQHPPRSITISEGIDAFSSTPAAAAHLSSKTKKMMSTKSRHMLPLSAARPTRLHHQQQRRIGTDREPLLGLIINNNNNTTSSSGSRTEQNQLLRMNNHFVFQQMVPPDDEPPPPYEIALRYCTPLYHRLRQSAHSLSSALFPLASSNLASSTSHTDMRQMRQQYAMDGPAAAAASSSSSTTQQC